jgi:hypothetical protein
LKLFSANDSLSFPFISSCNITGACCLDVDWSDNHAFVAGYSTGLQIIDASVPTNPTIVGYYNSGTAFRVTVRGNIAFVANHTNLCIYDCSQALGVIDRASDAVPESYSLNQNYPNPFNSSTTIEYTIPKTSKVDLKLYDITNRIVGTLVNLNQNPGTYRVKLDASKLASGIYFYRLNAGTFSTTNKLSVLK